MTERELQLLGLVNRRLGEAVEDCDRRTLAAVREVWQKVTPIQNCAPLTEVLREIRTIAAAGLEERTLAAQTVIAEMLGGFPDPLSQEFIDGAKQAAMGRFENDLHLPAARNTLGVYQRKPAPANKYSDEAYHHEFRIMEVGMANGVRRSRAALAALLDEWGLRKAPPPQPSQVVQSRSKKIAIWIKENQSWVIGLVGLILAVVGLLNG